MIEVLVDIDGTRCPGGAPTASWWRRRPGRRPTRSAQVRCSGPTSTPPRRALLAHALFARPLVLSPDSTVVIEMLENPPTGGVVWCDGRRSVDVPPSSELTVRRSPHTLALARTTLQPFVQRLVAKFDLPVDGWRGRAERRASGAGDAH